MTTKQDIRRLESAQQTAKLLNDNLIAVFSMTDNQYLSELAFPLIEQAAAINQKLNRLLIMAEMSDTKEGEAN